MFFNKFIPPTELENEKYHAINELDGLIAISSSGLRQAYKDAKLYYNKAKLLRMPSTSMELGSALHEAILQPEIFDIGNFSLTPANKTKFEIMKNNFLVMFDYLLPNTLKEHSIFYKDNGFVRKVRPDIYDDKNGIIYDIKTTKHTTLKGFADESLNFGYHMQVAFYIDTLRLAGFSVKGFGFLCIPSDSPCEPFAFQPTSDYIEYGRSAYTEALQKVLDFEKNKNLAFFHSLDLPKWIKEQLGS